MSSAIGFALLSLCFAGLNDVVFKRYSSRDRSRGMLVFGIGVVWLTLQTLTFVNKGGVPHTDATTLAFGTIAGVVLTLSNILLIESLTHIEISLGSTIYRLNTIGVALLSVLFLQESFGWTKAAGIGCGLLVVLLLTPPAPGTLASPERRLFIGVVILASLLRAIYGVLSKHALNHGADADTLLLIAAGSWVIGGALYARLREGRFQMTRKKAAYGLTSGVLVFLVANFLIAAVARGQASVVIPIANLSFVAALLMSVTMGMERVSGRKLVAVGCAIASIYLLSLP